MLNAIETTQGERKRRDRSRGQEGTQITSKSVADWQEAGRAKARKRNGAGSPKSKGTENPPCPGVITGAFESRLGFVLIRPDVRPGFGCENGEKQGLRS